MFTNTKTQNTKSQSDKLFLKGAAILKKHTDCSDCLYGPAILTCVGAPAVVVLEGIKCKIFMEPGDLLMMRADLVPHYVEQWFGERFSYVYFCDRYVFTEKSVNNTFVNNNKWCTGILMYILLP